MTDHNTPFSRLGAILRQLRLERGQEVEELAALAEIDQKILREFEESQGVPPFHLEHLDRLLHACKISLADLARGQRKLLAASIFVQKEGDREIDTLLRTIECLQERVTSLETQLIDRQSASMREFQMQSIKLLERTMETSGMSREEMRRLVSDMKVEDVP